MTITIDDKQMRIDGAKLRRLREQRFLSREELAQKSGIHRDSIGRIERGAWTGGSQLPTIRRLAEALGANPQEIVLSEEPTDLHRASRGPLHAAAEERTAGERCSLDEGMRKEKQAVVELLDQALRDAEPHTPEGTVAALRLSDGRRLLDELQNDKIDPETALGMAVFLGLASHVEHAGSVSHEEIAPRLAAAERERFRRWLQMASTEIEE